MLKNWVIPAALLALAASSAGYADSLTCHTQKRTVVVDFHRAALAHRFSRATVEARGTNHRLQAQCLSAD